MPSGYLAVAGTGVFLPTAGSAPELFARLAAARPLAGSRQRLAADHTDLPALDVPVGLCVDPAPSRPVRLAGLSRESRLAVCAAADALAPSGVRGEQVGVVWASSTAGLAEYGQTCVAAATLGAGQASPLTASVSGYNGPAAAVSIRLGLTGPHLTLTGCRDAGAAALVEAGRLLAEGRCRQVLVGGSAAVSRWRMAGAAPDAPYVAQDGTPYPAPCAPNDAPHLAPDAPDAVPVEGAVCLLLGGPPAGPVGGWSDAAVRPLRRARLRGPRPAAVLAAFVADCGALMAAPPDAIAVSAAGAWWELAAGTANGRGTPRWWVDRTGGEMGAAGGLQAIVAAVAGCGRATAGMSRILALAIGDGGDAVAVEVVSRDVVSRGKEHRDESV
jgi:hypothetical protein